MAETVEAIMDGWDRAKRIRTPREARFDEAFRLTMPGRSQFFDQTTTGRDEQADDVFDETAIVAVQEFASRIQDGITPNFSRWAQLQSGPTVDEKIRGEVDARLNEITNIVFEVLQASAFANESYETYLDGAVSVGFLEILKGTPADPIHCRSIPMSEMWIDNGPFGQIDRFYRCRKMSLNSFKVRYPDASIPADFEEDWQKEAKTRSFLEAYRRDWDVPLEKVIVHTVIDIESKRVVFQETFKGEGACPIIPLRWGKAAGEVWGRGPVMNALPAIRTVNAVVELILTHAHLSVAGVYQADDDGTINVETIELVPGTVIPRVPGTSGLEPVRAAGDFSITEIVLDDQRANIKRALYNDMLGNPTGTPMSATEVAERQADLARQIGSAFGRIKKEFADEVIKRVVYILKELGVFEIAPVNGREITVISESPLASAQNQQDILNIDRLVQFVQTRFGPEAANLLIKSEEVAEFVAKKLNVPDNLMRNEDERAQAMQAMAQLAQQQGLIQGGEEQGAEEQPVIQ